MSRILIVDDSSTRCDRISSFLESRFADSNLVIDFAKTVSQAKRMLKASHYSVLFLDLVLPDKKDSQFKSTDGGLRILKALRSGRLSKVPTRIIGITCDKNKAEDFESEIDLIGFRTYYAEEYDFSWLSKVEHQIDHALKSELSQSRRVSDFSLFTVHGIATYGSWQELLNKILKEDGEVPHFESADFKYREISVSRYFFPILRRRIVKIFETQFFDWITDQKNKRLVIVAHSFGTYALMKAIFNNIGNPLLDYIDTIILSGSVLKQKFPIQQIISKHNIKIFNECANKDIPLLLTNSFVIDTGMAGRRGFNGVQRVGGLTSRIYSGGHAVFFQNNGQIMKDHWLPIIKGLDFDPLTSSYEEPNAFYRTLEFISSFLCNVKWILYLFILCFIAFLIFWLI